MRLRSFYLLMALCMVMLYACKGKPGQLKISLPAFDPGKTISYKGLYNFSPEIKSFKECTTGREFWAVDSSAQLELQYSQMNNKPNEAVYIEVQGKKIKTVKDGIGSDYDSTLVVTKLIKITAEIPKTGCN